MARQYSTPFGSAGLVTVRYVGSTPIVSHKGNVEGYSVGYGTVKRNVDRGIWIPATQKAIKEAVKQAETEAKQLLAAHSKAAAYLNQLKG